MCAAKRGSDGRGATRRRRWTLYVLRCRDGTLYTGVTTDMDRRLAEHLAGTASRYTRARLPVTLVYREPAANRSAALRREAAVKRMTRRQKDRLVTAGGSGE